MSDFIAKEINNIEKKVNNIDSLVNQYKKLLTKEEIYELENITNDSLEKDFDELELNAFDELELNDFDDEPKSNIKLKVNQKENRENLLFALVDSGYKVSVVYDNDAFVLIEEGLEKFY